MRHIEAKSHSPGLIGFRQRGMAQETGRSQGIARDTFMRIELRVSGCVVTLEALITGVTRHPVSEKSRVHETGGSARVLALETHVMTGRAGESPICKRLTVAIRHRMVSGGNVGYMTTRSRVTAAAMTGRAKFLNVFRSQAKIRHVRYRTQMTHLAGRLVPVRVFLSADCNPQQPGNERG